MARRTNEMEWRFLLSFFGGLAESDVLSSTDENMNT